MREAAKKPPPPELGSDVPGLDRAMGHIMVRMSIALDGLLEGTDERKWFEETMRQDIRYFVWLYWSASGVR